jgi:hypothetical protein
MNLFDGFFPIFMITIIGLGFWNLYELTRFTRPDGQAKRGVKIWSESISWETCRILETLPTLTRYERGFILIEGREVLIAEERSFWQFGRRRRQLPYVAYINLSEPENRLEFRVPVSILATLIVTLSFFLIFFTNFFTFFGNDFQNPLGCLFPTIFLTIFISSILYNHYRERKRLLDILDQIKTQPMR